MEKLGLIRTLYQGIHIIDYNINKHKDRYIMIKYIDNKHIIGKIIDAEHMIVLKYVQGSFGSVKIYNFHPICINNTYLLDDDEVGAYLL